MTIRFILQKYPIKNQTDHRHKKMKNQTKIINYYNSINSKILCKQLLPTMMFF